MGRLLSLTRDRTRTILSDDVVPMSARAACLLSCLPAKAAYQEISGHTVVIAIAVVVARLSTVVWLRAGGFTESLYVQSWLRSRPQIQTTGDGMTSLAGRRC